MDLQINGGLFGDYHPNPTSETGHELMVRIIPGELGQEAADQRDYLVGSLMRGAPFESSVLEQLPDLGQTEYLASIVLIGPVDG